jgi:CHAT domain-containing protein
VAEIFNLQLNADLVTLSACDSGVNERRPGDELIGLTRALIYAGTPSVLVSLWSVHDLSTRLLMEKFYLELRKEAAEDGTSPVTKVAALQSAQKYLMRLTARDLVEHEEARSARLAEQGDSSTRQDLDRAAAYRLSGDIDAAQSFYRSALHRVEAQTDESARWLVQRAQRELSSLADLQRQNVERNPDSLAFDHLFHWAPFVLIGDWK